MMFNENYQVSKHMQVHFKKFCCQLISNFENKKNPFVIELGSNDGIMLKHLKFWNTSSIEPSKNVAGQKKRV